MEIHGPFKPQNGVCSVLIIGRTRQIITFDRARELLVLPMGIRPLWKMMFYCDRLDAGRDRAHGDAVCPDEYSNAKHTLRKRQ